MNLASRKSLVCHDLFLVANLDAFFGMLTKLIRQGDEEMQLANIKLLNCLLLSFLNWVSLLSISLLWALAKGKHQKTW